MATVGHVIRRLREQRDWTQGQLSTYSGVDQSYISRIERDQHEHISFKVLALLATALNVSLDSIAIEVGFLPAPDEHTIWHPELLVMQRVLDAVAEIDPQLRADLSRIVLGQAEGWRQLTELAKSSDIPEQDEGTNETL